MLSILNLYKKKQWLKSQNILNLVPYAISEFERIDNKIQIRQKRFPFKFLSKLFKKRPYYYIKLDEKGSKVWLLINKQNTVLQICNYIMNDNADDTIIQQTCQFITILYRKKLIDFSTPYS